MAATGSRVGGEVGAQPALHVQGRDDGLLLGGGERFGFARGPGGT
jgi:hypothetical protein